MPPLTMPRPRAWRACSGRTSSSSKTRCITRCGTPDRGRETVPVRGRPRPALEQHPAGPRGARRGGHPALQRLRYVRQLGHAFLVYPGATHSRFEHALGAYHLARRALAQLEETTGARLDAGDALAIRVAALLHDIGHYPFSHALEEAGLPRHEALAERHLAGGDLATRLAQIGARCETLLALIQGRSRAPLEIGRAHV